MIPFKHTWPYEIIMNDIYVSECPFCGKENVLIPLKKRELAAIREGAKKMLVFPCCFNKVTIIDTDPDYLLTDQPLRGNNK
jgi:hypothetical protein